MNTVLSSQKAKVMYAAVVRQILAHYKVAVFSFV